MPSSSPPRFLSWRLAVVIAITALVLWVLWTRVADGGQLLETLKRGDPAAIAGAAGMMLFAMFCAALRLRFVLGAMGHRVSVLRVLHATVAVWPLSVVAPSRLNELLRAVVLRDQVPMVEGIGAVLAERVVDVQTLCLLAMLGGIAIGNAPLAAIAGCGVVAVWLGAAFLALWPERLLALPLVRNKAEKVERLVSAFDALRRKPAYLLGVMVCSAGVWLVAVTIVFVLLRAFDATVAYGVTLALWPLAVFVGMLPLTLSGMGTRDAAFLSLLATAGFTVGEEAVLSATITYAVVTTIFPSILGLPWMIGQLDSLRGLDRDDG